MTLTLLAAVAANRVIGANGNLVFELPGDLARFKALTLGKPVIMGRKTWESLPKKPLPGRLNIVLTHNPAWQAEGAVTVTSAVEALALVAAEPEACVIGGGEVYALFLPHATRLELTEVKAEAAGNVRFPEVNATLWQEIARTPGQPEGFAPAFDYVTYTRR